MNKPAEAVEHPLVFPYNLGPALRGFTPALLYSGGMTVTIPGWVSGLPPVGFDRVYQRAVEREHELLQIFRAVRHYGSLAVEQAIAESAHLKPLGERIRRIQLVQSGTGERYASWEPHHDPLLGLAALALEQEVPARNVAAVEFIWRVWESLLEQDHDVDKVLDLLSARAQRLGDASLLLAESYLNRFAIGRQGAAGLLTDSELAVTMLAELGGAGEAGGDTAPLRAEQLAFLLFDQLISPYAPGLYAHQIAEVNGLLEERREELERMRRKCRRSAEDLVKEAPAKSDLQHGISRALEDMKEEVASVAKLEGKALRQLYERVAEDRVVWTTVAGLVGSGAVKVPSEVIASLAVTALSSIGVSAVRGRRELKETLKDSPWAVVYYLSKRGR